MLVLNTDKPKTVGYKKNIKYLHSIQVFNDVQTWIKTITDEISW